MAWGAVAGAAISVAGGMMASDAASGAASEASNAQIQSSQAAVSEQRRQFDTIRQLLSPYVQAGTGSPTYAPLTRYDLVDTSGGSFKPNANLYANNAEYKAAWDAYIAANPQQPAGGLQNFNAASNDPESAGFLNFQSKFAQGNQPADLEGALNFLSSRFNLDNYNAAQAALPKTKGSLPTQQDLLGLNGPQAQQAAFDAAQNSPYFSGLIQQGENAILQNASATGGLRGGNTQAALAQFRPQMLAQYLNDYYSKLGGLTSIGQNAAAGVGNAGMQSTNQISALLQQQGAAQAGNALAQGQIAANQWSGIGSAIGQIGGLINSNGGGSTGGGSTGGFLGNGITGSIF